ncbi:MAG: hypothetical protein KIS94_09370 [Chitinophagales bacterium]|nr:hypothetical protein [Chitinophagales bacterium]
MTYLQALYGSQHRDLKANGYDGTKARFNGNLFLSAFVIVALFVVLMIVLLVYPSANKAITQFFQEVFGYSSGKMIGKLLAILLLAIVYFGITNTVGSEANSSRYIEEFYREAEAEQAGATKKLLLPFFVLLGLLLVLALGSLF